MKFGSVKTFLVAFAAGGILAMFGPLSGLLLARNEILPLSVSGTNRAVFIAMMLSPCVIGVLMSLQQLRQAPLFGGTATVGVIASCVAVLGYELFDVLYKMLF